MESKIIKTKFKCKAGSQKGVSDGVFTEYCGTSGKSKPQLKMKWVDRFIEGKWYDGEYEDWWFEDGKRLNDGFKRYWVVNEMGEKEEISKAHMQAIFYYKEDDIRDTIIDEILDKGDKEI